MIHVHICNNGNTHMHAAHRAPGIRKSCTYDIDIDRDALQQDVVCACMRMHMYIAIDIDHELQSVRSWFEHDIDISMMVQGKKQINEKPKTKIIETCFAIAANHAPVLIYLIIILWKFSFISSGTLAHWF